MEQLITGKRRTVITDEPLMIVKKHRKFLGIESREFNSIEKRFFKGKADEIQLLNETKKILKYDIFFRLVEK